MQQGFLTLPDGHPAMMVMGEPTGKTEKVDPEEEKKRKNSFATFASGESSNESFVPYYCFACGSFVMAVDGRLHQMPRRKTDSAIVLDSKKRLKHRLEQGEVKTLKREGGVEKQYRWRCTCGVPISYQSSEWTTEVQYVYIIDCSLALNPSVVSLYWREEGRMLPECFSVQQEDEEEAKTEGSKQEPVVVIAIEVVPECKRFGIQKLEERMVVEVAAQVVGGDMKLANSEAVKGVVKVLGSSSKQVKLDHAANALCISGISSKDAMRRLVCAMH
mmetsp:Transcript_27477/g.53601  ORF Transcript_27477/g.53601 Transcript_27477/m.53601 type:complete len:274 (-) Transcript_27477:96-917(-)|eukprot:CAMPEP_0173385448 /NCGR_PEP_ID=MMETSP1356-20130122/8049_1 /TAXON_ID=77927 ORGANISM="Hemiselmis virescens, Strain PCC157" /NCGR_SAMPLE_ID=MMETSP1356 /ASSEMBLY_ACC=CAM_ASM_000847 /LENGTH=273 /DNA_ID=CAMNT_0014341253 /DNA_START=46 /DNA_END=867 /DNA_ORIENTATION=-